MVADTMFDIVHDARTLVTSILGLVEFLIGISYVGGKYLTEGIVDGALIFWQFSKDVVEGVQFSFQVLSEAAERLLRAVFLIYYSIGFIADAFYITFMDLVSFLQHGTRTLGMFIESCFYLFLSSVTSLVVIPDQLCSALSIIGDFFLGLCQFLASGITTTGLILLAIPGQFFRSLTLVLSYLILLPQQVIYSIPVSAHIGILVLVLSYFVYCRLSFRLFFRSSLNLFRRAITICLRSATVLLNCWQKPSRIKGGHGGVSADKAAGGSKQDKTGNDLHGICVLCFEQPVAYLASPCNHICVCKDCCHQLVNADSRCPLCRKNVDVYSRVYIS